MAIERAGDYGNTLTGIAQQRNRFTGAIKSKDQAIDALDRNRSGISRFSKDILPNVAVATAFNRDYNSPAVARGRRDLASLQEHEAAGTESGFVRAHKNANPARYAALQRAVLGDQATRAGTIGDTPEYMAGFESETQARTDGSKKGIQAANWAYQAALQRALGQPTSGLPSKQVK